MAFDLVACNKDIKNGPVGYICLTNYFASSKRGVNTTKQISYSAPKRCLFHPCGGERVYTAVASHCSSPVRKHRHGNLQLSKGSWHV